MKAKIVNVVATGSLNHPVSLNKLSSIAEVTYNPQRYGGRVAYFKTREMEGKVSIFCSGKLISVGTKSEKQACKELRLTAMLIGKRGLIPKVEIQPKIENIVATADLGKELELEKLCEKMKAIYEPEQFPGAILRLEEPFRTSILIFASGKMVITGLKSADQLEPTINRVQAMISNQ